MACAAASGGSRNSSIESRTDYQPGPLGKYYYPTNGTNLFSLVNAGSRTADLAGLYHHTVRVDQLNNSLQEVSAPSRLQVQPS